MATIFGALPYILQNGTVADATQVMADYNKIISDGNANAAENGVNSSITSLLGLTTPIPIAGGSSTHFIGATSGGAAAAQTIATTTPVNWSLTSGFEISFLPGFSSVAGGTTLSVAGGTALAVRKPTPSGPVALAANDWVAGQMATVVYDGTAYLTQSEVAYAPYFGALTTLASAATTDLGTIASHVVQITGTTAITSFGATASTAAALYVLEFASTLTLTYNATSMILPGGGNIYTGAGDYALALYLGSGNWQVLSYQSGAQTPSIAPVPGLFKNLVVTATSDTTVTITADALQLFDTSGRSFRASAVSLLNTITGSGANGLDTGSLVAGTFYSVWAIYNQTTNTVASLVSTSTGSPTLPSGYTFMVRVGWVFYAIGARLWRTIQRGRDVQVQLGTFPLIAPLIASGNTGAFDAVNPALTSVSLSSFVPVTASKVRISVYNNWKNASGSNVLIAPNVNYGGTQNGPQGSNGQVYPVYLNSGSFAGISTEIVLETPQSIAIAAQNSGHATALLGWTDNI